MDLTSLQEAKAINKNLLNSVFELLLKPSAILLEIDTEALQI